MLALLKTYWRILLKELGPANLPASDALLLVTIIFNAAVFFASGFLIMQTLETLAISYGIRLVSLFVFIGFVLSLYHKQRRWRETAMALLGVQAIVELITLPLGGLIFWQPESQLVTELVVIAAFTIMLWIVVVNTHIIQQATEQTFYIALLFVIAHAVIAFWIFQQFFEVKV
ncbi:MAG: hypothetical protein HKM24_00575 [Gammaproteobacteria bacterium]|nr:hypothetical protein [Gammaproteobacteria bacterium]